MTVPSHSSVSNGPAVLTIPAILSCDAPRPVKPRNPAETGVARIFAFVIFLLIGLLPWLYFASRYAVYTSGQDVSATVVGSSTSSSGGTKTYFINYAYDVDGHHYTGSERVGFEEGYFGHRAGEVIKIKRLNILGIEMNAMFSKTSHWWSSTWLALLVAVLVSAAVGAGFYFLIGAPNARRRLVAKGIAVRGRITSKYVTKGNASEFKWVKFQYELRGGTWLEGKMQVDRRFYDHAAVDQPIIVFYDPKDAEHAVIYEACEFEVDEAAMQSQRPTSQPTSAKV